MCHSLLAYYQEKNEKTVVSYGKKLGSGVLNRKNWQKSVAHVNMPYNESIHRQPSFLLVIWLTELG